MSDDATLVLFDVDGTLIESHRVGRDAMDAAGRSLFGEDFTFKGVTFAGALDGSILDQALTAAGRTIEPAAREAFFAAYLDALTQRLTRPPRPRALPGVERALADLAGPTPHGPGRLGLLTGNHRSAARLKLHAAGIATDPFTVNAFGDEGATRPDLVELALRRYREALGRDVSPARTVVIGDTPNDMEAARAHGCVAVGVATGSYDADALIAAGADRVLDDLRQWAGLDVLR